MTSKIDDYELYEQDFDEFIRRGMQEFGYKQPVKKDDQPVRLRRLSE